MVRFAKSSHWPMLTLFAVLTGCAVPASRSEPRSIAVIDAPTRVLPASVTPLGSGAITMVSHSSDQAPADASPQGPRAAGEPASDPEGVPPGARTRASIHPESEQGECAPSVAIPHSEFGPESSAALAPSDDPFSGQAELTVDQLVTEVQVRNPSLQAASDAWRAATERYPQVVSLDDPMFAFMISPSGVGMDNGGGWMVQASQKIPWAGKRCLRGSIASAEADVMQGDIGDARLRLAEAAKVAFYDYYVAWRQMEVNSTTQKLVQQFREIASNKYQVNQASQQDVLQADVELADLATRNAELTRDQQVAAARINTLLHRAADHPLPPPPAEAPFPDGLPAAEELQQAAVRSRPDLYAQLSRIEAEEANLGLACREYYPDLNLVARYDGFMPEDMRPQVGMDVNIPIRIARRSAALREASHRIAQRRAEYENLLDQVQFDVQSSFARVVQSAEVVRLYRDKSLPAAERSFESAQASYTTGTLDFLRLLDAERRLNEQREKYFAAIAEYHRRLAELERAVGEPIH